MKNLVAKAGVAAVTSVLLTSVISAPEAQAIELSPSNSGTLVFGSRDGSPEKTLRPLEIPTTTGQAFLDAGAVEAGEYLGNETRGYFEYDLTELEADIFDPDFFSFEYTLNFDVFSDGGTGAAGSAGNGSNLGNKFDGIVKASWYLGSAFNPLSFDPLLGPESGTCADFAGGCDNPLAEIDMSTIGAGDSVSIDVSNLVKQLLDTGTDESFGIMLQAIAKDGTTLGLCGDNAGRVCEGVTFTSGLQEVPTPAAILPALFGLASAAFGKKCNQESEV